MTLATFDKVVIKRWHRYLQAPDHWHRLDTYQLPKTCRLHSPAFFHLSFYLQVAFSDSKDVFSSLNQISCKTITSVKNYLGITLHHTMSVFINRNGYRYVEGIIWINSTRYSYSLVSTVNENSHSEKCDHSYYYTDYDYDYTDYSIFLFGCEGSLCCGPGNVVCEMKIIQFICRENL